MSGHDNGIAWREWNEETFAEAKRLDKPVLLDIGAVWCHWCHVMDDGIPGDPVHTGTYANAEVQKRIEAGFIPVKVDNDRRPDINARYNMGGWPTTAFLTPEGDILYGETYVHPSRMIGLLDHISEVYKTQRDQIHEQMLEMRARRSDAARDDDADKELPADAGDIVAASIVQNFDPLYGGFGTQPKFPHPDALLFALERYSQSGDERLRTFAEKTMTGMDSGGMYDRFAGGFFRYSTTRDWSIPHYEKMLEDNARLTEAYTLASVVLSDERYLETVRTSHEWLMTTMRDEATGTFAGSQDADAEEHYYGEPLDVRATLPTPYIDRTVYANWNALIISSLAKRFQVTGERAILDFAVTAYMFLMDNLAIFGEAGEIAFAHFWANGAAQGSAGLLVDQTAMLTASIDLYESTGEISYLDRALGVVGYLLKGLQDLEFGGFFDLSPDPESIGELAAPRKDIKENADAAIPLLRLAQLTESPVYRDAAVRALKSFAGEFRNSGYFASGYARAVEMALREPLHIVVAGEPGEPKTSDLLAVAWKAVSPGKTVSPIGLSEKDGFTVGANGEPRAFVCVGTRCLAPALTAEELRGRIFEALSVPINES